MRRSRRALALIVTGLLMACSNDPVVPPVVVQTNVRVVHAMSDVGDLNALVNGIPTFRAIPFGGASPASGWSPVDDKPEFTLAPVNGPDLFYRERYTSVTGVNDRWTFIALGNLRDTVRSDTLIVLKDTTSTPTLAWIRVLNALDYLPTPGRDTVDIYTYPSTATRPATPDIGSFPRFGRTRYLDRTTGTWRIDVLDNRANPATATPLFSTTITLNAGTIRTLILRDPPFGSPAGTAGAIITLADRN
jgi:hypothetical protein